MSSVARLSTSPSRGMIFDVSRPGWLRLLAGLTLVLVAGAGAAEPVFRLDLEKVAVLLVYHPTVLASAGYYTTYRVDVPDEQFGEFTKAGSAAEFDMVEVWAGSSGVREVRVSKEGDPTALSIFQLAGSLVAAWYLPGPRSPQIPAGPEVSRRFTIAAELFGKTQQALGLAGFKGGNAGTFPPNLAGVENLSLESRGAPVTYEYRFFALATDQLSEELKIEDPSGESLSLELGSDRFRVVRETGATTARLRSELSVESAAWEAEARSSGGRQALSRPEAESLLRTALAALKAARQHFGIEFGRNVDGVRLP